MKGGVIVLTVLLFGLMGIASAHQLRIVMDIFNNSISQPIVISNPEVSQAFYGNLTGKPAFYALSADSGFLLYLNILSPDINNSRKDFSAVIYKFTPGEIPGVDNGTLVSVLNGTSFEWAKFYEEFAGDSYWSGPSYENPEEAGMYIIKIYNPGNSGRYSLSVGKNEVFGFRDSLDSFFLLPKIKVRFFEKSVFSVFQGLIYKYFVLGSFFLILFIVLIIAVIKMISQHIARERMRRIYRQ